MDLAQFGISTDTGRLDRSRCLPGDAIHVGGKACLPSRDAVRDPREDRTLRLVPAKPEPVPAPPAGFTSAAAAEDALLAKGEIPVPSEGGCGVAVHPEVAMLIDVLSPVTEKLIKHSAGWLSSIVRLRAEWSDVSELQDIEGINPNQFMHQLSRVNTDAGAYVVDVGQHQMWAAQSLEIQQYQRFLTSGGMGSMGFGLPAAIGAAITLPGLPIVMIAGDGSFQCNIQELQTAVHHSLPLRMVVLNNRCHGMVRQFQQSYFAGRYQSTMWGYSAPDFSAVAAAYGIPARTISAPSEVEDAVSWLAQHLNGPSLLQVTISSHANAYPKLAFGKGIASMEPTVLSSEMEGT